MGRGVVLIFLRKVKGKGNKKRFKEVYTEENPLAFDRTTAQGLEPVPAGLN